MVDTIISRHSNKINITDCITGDGTKKYKPYGLNNEFTKYFASVSGVHAKKMPSLQKSAINYLCRIPWHTISIFINNTNEGQI